MVAVSMRLVACCLSLNLAAALQCGTPLPAKKACARGGLPLMDETVMARALEGTLEEEGAENIWLSEVGWAAYLDQNAGSSYNMNQRPSMADDGYLTPSILSNPIDVFTGWIESLVGAASAPVATAFPSIQNDPTGARSWPTGATEVNARTIKPKVKDFDPKLRVNKRGFNDWGAPSVEAKPLKD